MVDWSGGARRRGNRSDTIWIAHGRTSADHSATTSPFSRGEAIELVGALLEEEIANGSRVLVCFDFAYGYPRDFPASLLTATGKGDADLPWLQVWRYLSEAIRDDEGTTPGRRPTNRSNRFEVANQINSLLSISSEAAGPFWCGGSEAHRYIPPKRPPQPFQTAQGYTVKPLRLTDERARSGTPFRLFGTASVGSQSLTGIAHLHKSYVTTTGLKGYLLCGRLRLGGQLRPIGCVKAPRSFTRKSIQALESQNQIPSKIVDKCGQCGNGPAIWIDKICCGVNSAVRSILTQGQRRISLSS
jgi:hypothetical protein